MTTMPICVTDTLTCAWLREALAAGMEPVAYTASDGSKGVWCWGDDPPDLPLPDEFDYELAHDLLSAAGRVLKPRTF